MRKKRSRGESVKVTILKHRQHIANKTEVHSLLAEGMVYVCVCGMETEASVRHRSLGLSLPSGRVRKEAAGPKLP